MAGEKRIKTKKLTIRLTPEMKEDWENYLEINDLKGQQIIENYIAKLLYQDQEI